MFTYQQINDSDEMAEARRRELSMPRHVAQALGASAVVAAREGRYFDEHGQSVDWSAEVANAVASKISIPPNEALSNPSSPWFNETSVQVTNETTLGVGKRLVAQGKKPLALNFANGIHPGGGFLSGALAQEECLCRSSALYITLENDPMYECHKDRPLPDSTDWAIYSPNVPVFRTDDGTSLEKTWQLSFITSAAPVATRMDKTLAAKLLEQRIFKILAVAHSLCYEQLILGAWGCGAFGNDPLRTAQSFRHTLEEHFSNAFAEIVFAITDWSTERRFLGPFRDVFR
jgi:uncharacterized protein (TIGR02452 family)